MKIKLKDIEWKTKDGKRIKVINMTERYIQNCINLLNRKMDTFVDHDKKVARNWIEVFNIELMRRERASLSLLDILADEFQDPQEEADHWQYDMDL